MSNEKEQKPTVLEANFAFDASPALFESIMEEGPIKYGPDDDGLDMITTPEGDEVVDPRSIMDVNVDAPVQSGAVFNQDFDSISQEEGDRYMEQFQDYVENVHKKDVNIDELIDVGGTMIQGLNDTTQDVSGYLRQQINDAANRLSQQNVNPAQPDGVAADMTGEDRIPADGGEGGLDAGADAGLGGEGAPDLGDEGLAEIDSTTHLTPEEDTGAEGLGDIDMGLGELDGLGGEPAPEAGAEAGADDGLGAEPAAPVEGGEGADLGGDVPPEGGEAPAEGGEAPAEPETGSEPSEGGDDYDPFSDLDLGGDTGDGDEEPSGDDAPAPVSGDEEPSGDEPSGDGDEPKEDDKDKDAAPLTESEDMKNFRIRLESVMGTYDALCKRREAKAKCEAIVNAANKKMISESVNQKKLKAQCEAIVGAYRKATGANQLKTKLEGIVGKYRKQKMLAESVAASATAVNQKPIMDNNARFAKMKAQCESIVSDFRKAESTANTAKAIIDSYKQSLV